MTDPRSREERFPALVEKVPEMLSFVTRFASAAGLTTDQIARLEVATEEAAVNVCRYAYAGKPGPLCLRTRDETGRFVVEVEDEGIAFNPLAGGAPDVSAGIEERAVGGLGIFLFRKFVDDVAYRREKDCNILSLAMKAGS